MKASSVSKLDFGPGKANITGDFLLKSHNCNNRRARVDVLIFADSRGTNLKSSHDSWAARMFNFIRRKELSCLLAVRPRDCTLFLTLLNFLKLNKLRFNYLIAQIGFVDFTPKKKEVIKDIIGQRSAFFNKTKFKIERLNKYELSNKKIEHLYSIDFNKKTFKRQIVKCIEGQFKNTIFIEALEVNSNIKLKRKRPVEFYEKLKESNRFLSDLSKMSKKIQCVRPMEETFCDNPSFLTYDGVHYTALAHKRIYELTRDAFKNIYEVPG